MLVFSNVNSDSRTVLKDIVGLYQLQLQFNLEPRSLGIQFIIVWRINGLVKVFKVIVDRVDVMVNIVFKVIVAGIKVRQIQFSLNNFFIDFFSRQKY